LSITTTQRLQDSSIHRCISTILFLVKAYHLTMWRSSSLLCLFLILGCISASQTSLFAPRGRAKPKDVLLRTIASTTGTTKDDGPPLKPFPQTIKNDGPIKVFTQTIKDARRHLAAAGIARCISIFAMYPVDTIKVRNDFIRYFFQNVMVSNSPAQMLVVLAEGMKESTDTCVYYA
jgi:hypothetical protein